MSPDKEDLFSFDELRERARKAVPNPGLTWIAEIAAQQHKYAIEYIEQAPVLVIGVTFGASLKKPTRGESAFIANRFKRIEGMRLKDAMKEFQLPYPLRKLRSTAITPSMTEVIWDLRSVPPSALSQAIPDRPGCQKWWLNAIKAAKDRARWRSRQFPAEAKQWLATRIVVTPGVNGRQLAAQAADLTDMFIDGRFNPVWTFEEAVNAHAQWAVDQAKRMSSSSFAAKYGVDLEHAVDYAPQPNEPRTVGEFEIVPLRSGEDLVVEGTIMRHCVPGYMSELLSARSCIYSMRRNGKRVATLELSSGGNPMVKQLKGPCNSAVGSGVEAAAVEFAKGLVVPRRTAMDKLKGLLRGG